MEVDGFAVMSMSQQETLNHISRNTFCGIIGIQSKYIRSFQGVTLVIIKLLLTVTPAGTFCIVNVKVLLVLTSTDIDT